MAVDATAPLTFKLDSTGDLDFDTSLGMSTLTGLEATVQSIKVACALFKGEWFWDLEAGVPYLQDILGHAYDQQAVLAIFRRQILTVPNVLQIIEIGSVFDSANRTLTVTFEVSTEFGEAQDEVTL